MMMGTGRNPLRSSNQLLRSTAPSSGSINGFCSATAAPLHIRSQKQIPLGTHDNVFSVRNNPSHTMFARALVQSSVLSHVSAGTEQNSIQDNRNSSSFTACLRQANYF